MWNVCAEPIECCVYIKATLFLTIPAPLSESDCARRKRTVDGDLRRRRRCRHAVPLGGVLNTR